MSAAANKETALKFIEVLSSGRIEESLVTPDVSWWVPGIGDVARKDFLVMAAGFRAQVEGEVVMMVHGVTAEGDRVAIEAESRAQLKNGKVYNNTYHFLFEFKDGKIRKAKEYNDSAHVARVMGGL